MTKKQSPLLLAGILLENLMVLLLNHTKGQSQRVQEFKIKLLVVIAIIKVVRELILSAVD